MINQRRLSLSASSGVAADNYVDDVVMMGSVNLAHGSGLCLDLQVVLDNPISGRQPVRDPGVPALVGAAHLRLRSTSMQKHL